MKYSSIKARIAACMLLATLGMAFAPGKANAQPGKKQQVLQELRGIIGHYYQAPRIGFDVVYRYSREESPGVYLDSLKGSFKKSGDRYWYTLDSMETIGNRDTAVILFKQDEIMYLTKRPGAMHNNSPLAMLDSFFLNNNEFDFLITDLPAETRITISAGKPDKFKKLEYFINQQTGLLVKIQSTIDASLLYDETVQQMVGEDPGFVIVEMLFRNYQLKQVETDIPDTRKYFKKVGQQYISQPPYQSYKIFVGSPNL